MESVWEIGRLLEQKTSCVLKLCEYGIFKKYLHF